MKRIKNFTFIFSILFIFQGFISIGKKPSEIIATATYKMGSDSKTIELSSLRASIVVEKTEEKGKEKKNSSVTFTIYDLVNNLAFRFQVKDDYVLNEFKGDYPLKVPGGFREGESLKSTSLMIIDTQNASNIWQSQKGGTCNLVVSGSTIKIMIKNASIAMGDNKKSFAFDLSTDKAKIKIKQEGN